MPEHSFLEREREVVMIADTTKEAGRRKGGEWTFPLSPVPLGTVHFPPTVKTKDIYSCVKSTPTTV